MSTMAKTLGLLSCRAFLFAHKPTPFIWQKITSRHIAADVTTIPQENTEISNTEVSLVSEKKKPVFLPVTKNYPSKFAIARQGWIKNLDTIKEKKLGLIDLHPSVFADMPRIDIIFHNLRWQRNYNRIDFRTERNRAEMPGGGRKPWPQKGTGRARHGSIRSPLWIGGGKAHGLRGPKTFFYMINHRMRCRGLTSMLSCKFAQDDLVIVDSLDIPSEDPKYIQELVEQRKWGLSVLFINDLEIMPKSITLATDNENYYTLMPYYGLNVYSMLKYDTLVITAKALKKIEERLLFNLNRSDAFQLNKKFSLRDINTKVLWHNKPETNDVEL